MLGRRAFLASLGAAFVIDPERLLWVPGSKVISIPKPRLVTEPYFVTEIWHRRPSGYVIAGAADGWTRRVYLGQHGPQGKLLEESLWPSEKAPFALIPTRRNDRYGHPAQQPETITIARLVSPEDPQGHMGTPEDWRPHFRS